MAKSRPSRTATADKRPAFLSPFDVLTLAEAAAYLRLPEDAVRAEAEAGWLVGQQVRGEWRFVRGGIVKWLQTPPPRKLPLGSPRVEETAEEYEAFMTTLHAQRDETNRATKSGKYAEE